MMTQVPEQQAIFPDLPRNQPFLDDDGKVNMYWLLFFDQLILALQTNFSNEGIVVPLQSAANIARLAGTLATSNILYDSTNNLFKGNINGTWKTFTLT